VIGTNPVIAGATGYTADGVTAWTPNTCCSNNVPLAQADISPAYDIRAIDKTAGYKSWGLTTMVREWLAAPASNFGLLLNSDTAKLAGRYRFFASTRHPDGTIRPVLRVTYLASAVADTTLPSVAIIAPAAGATLSGTVTVSATASDNVGVGRVQFQLDGIDQGVAVTTAPYSILWNTTTTTNAAHALTAQAVDLVGNAMTSAPVTVANPSPTPVLTAHAPSSATMGGAAFTLTVTGSGFVPASTVRWNGAARTTTFANGTQLTAASSATDLAGWRTEGREGSGRGFDSHRLHHVCSGKSRHGHIVWRSEPLGSSPATGPLSAGRHGLSAI